MKASRAPGLAEVRAHSPAASELPLENDVTGPGASWVSPEDLAPRPSTGCPVQDGKATRLQLQLREAGLPSLRPKSVGAASLSPCFH